MTTTKRPAVRRVLRASGVLLMAAAAGACSDRTGPGDGFGSDLSCSIPEEQILPGGPGKDGIPALTDPLMVSPTSSGAEYLADSARVIGFEVEGQPYAVPLNIMWWHEIVNLNLDPIQLAVTHCPLTGSSLAFDRATVDGAEFGVSGLLYLNNLVMYDRSSGESLWPQMIRGARCGPRDGTDLEMYPLVEMRWARWRELRPNTRVVSNQTGHPRNYNRYPYGDYDELNNSATLFPMPSTDSRRPPKERVLGIPGGDGGVAYPFGTLDQIGPLAVVDGAADGRSIVVLWSRTARSAMAFEPVVDGQPLTLRVVDGAITDQETGSIWAEDGRAVDGPLAGERLPPVDEAFIAFWFAWAGFYPETTLWDGGAS